MRALVVFAAVAALAVGCGAVENEPNLAAAAERTEASGSTRFDVRGTERVDERSVEIVCEGAGDYVRTRIRIRCEYGDLGDLEIVGIAGDVYIRGPLYVGEGSEGRWIKETGDDSTLFDFSPEKLLAMLRTASEETVRVGDEDVRGVATVRYRLTVRCGDAELDCAGRAPVEVWIDDEGLVRRIALEDDTEEFTFEFYDFGAEVDIEPPPAEDVIEEETLGSGGITVEPAVPCTEGAGKPITEERALSVLRAHGFSMRISDCVGGAGVVAGITNHEEADDVLDVEGLVFCHVYKTPPKGASRNVVRRGADGADAELALENLECTILADSPTGEEKIDKLEAAFAELERAIRP